LLIIQIIDEYLNYNLSMLLLIFDTELIKFNAI